MIRDPEIITRGLVHAGGKVLVAASAAPAARHHDALVGPGEIVYLRATLFVVDNRPHNALRLLGYEGDEWGTIPIIRDQDDAVRRIVGDLVSARFAACADHLLNRKGIAVDNIHSAVVQAHPDLMGSGD